MLPNLNSRVSHYLLLILVAGLLFLPNLGAHTLWDVDESHNAECAREMFDGGEWIVPTFNFDLRTDKPVLLYWVMMGFYSLFGVTEFAARFGSALCGIGSTLVVYELGRRMFDARTGLLAGVILASAVMFCVSSHAATPDALLIFFTLSTLAIFWHGYGQTKPNWLIWIGVTTAFGVLAKGPVGIVLPATAIGLFLFWERRLGILWNRRLLFGVILHGLIAYPWYILVLIETRGEFIEGFFLKHNFGRFTGAMEGHSGNFLYQPLALLAGFAPWSVFMALTVWYGVGNQARADEIATDDSPQRRQGQPELNSLACAAGYRFLWCWLLLWIVFFSVSATKLPNYILPAYPALALLTARFLVRWRLGAIEPSPALLAVCFGCFALIGVIVGGGLLIASGQFDLELLEGRELPEFAPWAWTGLIPLAAAGWCWREARRHRPARATAIMAVACVVLVALLGSVGPVVANPHKVPSILAQRMEENRVGHEYQIGVYGKYRPALVYYSQREVRFFQKADRAIQLLHSPLQTFLIVSTEDWEQLRPAMKKPHHIVHRQRDLATGGEILLITNRL